MSELQIADFLYVPFTAFTDEGKQDKCQVAPYDDNGKNRTLKIFEDKFF